MARPPKYTDDQLEAYITHAYEQTGTNGHGIKQWPTVDDLRALASTDRIAAALRRAKDAEHSLARIERRYFDALARLAGLSPNEAFTQLTDIEHGRTGSPSRMSKDELLVLRTVQGQRFHDDPQRIPTREQLLAEGRNPSAHAFHAAAMSPTSTALFKAMEQETRKTNATTNEPGSD